MINIRELQKRYQEFKGDNVGAFIRFIDTKQKKGGRKVITLEDREVATRLNELKQRQNENKPFDPQEDFDKLN